MGMKTMLSHVKNLASEYCKNTSAHGVHYVVSSSNAAKKVGWILILCGVLVGSSYHISQLISCYLEYNYYTSITLDARKPLTFPWVTVCSTQPVSQYSSMKNAELLLKSRIEILQRINVVVNMSKINGTDKDKILYQLASKNAFVYGLPPEKRYELSHSQNDLIIDCKFHGLPCDDTFKLLWSPEFLNCYTFTGFETKTYSVGVENGLSLILKEDELSWSIGLYSDKSNIQSSKGLRITIHEPHTIPDLLGNSIELVPGYSTTVSIQQKNMDRISTPKSKCMSKAWTAHQSDVNLSLRSTYFSCRLQCEIEYVWNTCGCLPDIKPELYPFQNDNNHLHCTFANNSETASLLEMLLKMRCQLNTMEELNTIMDADIHPPCIKECDWDCNSIEYSTDISYSRWPLDREVPSFLYQYVQLKTNKINKDYYNILQYKYSGTFHRHYNQQDIFTDSDLLQINNKILYPSASMTEITNELKTKIANKTVIPSINSRYLNLSSIREAEVKWVQDSFSRLNIFFKEPVVQLHRQVLDYGLADFWSSLGGILGLWAGISIITVIELFEFLGHLLKALAERACRMNMKSLEKD